MPSKPVSRTWPAPSAIRCSDERMSEASSRTPCISPARSSCRRRLASLRESLADSAARWRATRVPSASGPSRPASRRACIPSSRLASGSASTPSRRHGYGCGPESRCSRCGSVPDGSAIVRHRRKRSSASAPPSTWPMFRPERYATPVSSAPPRRGRVGARLHQVPPPVKIHQLPAGAGPLFAGRLPRQPHRQGPRTDHPQSLAHPQLDPFRQDRVPAVCGQFHDHHRMRFPTPHAPEAKYEHPLIRHGLHPGDHGGQGFRVLTRFRWRTRHDQAPARRQIHLQRPVPEPHEGFHRLPAQLHRPCPGPPQPRPQLGGHGTREARVPDHRRNRSRPHTGMARALPLIVLPNAPAVG